MVGHGFRLYPTELAKLFPGDLDFRDLGFDSYAGHPLNDAAGQPVGLIAVVSRRRLDRPAFVESVMRIFAVRVNAELARVSSSEALRASQASYREIFEASEDAIFVHDWETGAILDANASACAIYGYSREEFAGVRLADLSTGVPPCTGRGRRIPEDRCGVGQETNFFEYLDFALQFAPAGPEEQEIRRKLARIGVGPGKTFNFKNLSLEHKVEIGLGMKEGEKKVEGKIANLGKRINGWQVGSAFGDRDFYHGDLLLRAAAAKAGIFGNDAAEAMYPMTRWLADGEPLDGSKGRYTLTFAAGQEPPVSAFWSRPGP